MLYCSILLTFGIRNYGRHQEYKQVENKTATHVKTNHKVPVSRLCYSCPVNSSNVGIATGVRWFDSTDMIDWTVQTSDAKFKHFYAFHLVDRADQTIVAKMTDLFHQLQRVVDPLCHALEFNIEFAGDVCWTIVVLPKKE